MLEGLTNDAYRSSELSAISLHLFMVIRGSIEAESHADVVIALGVG